MRRMVALAALAILLAGLTIGAQTASAQANPPGNPVVIEGTLSLLVEDDFLGGHANKKHFLDEAGPGKHHELKLAKHQEDTLQPGMKIRVVGRFKDGGVLSADAPDENIVILSAATATAPVAARKVLVLLIDIIDAGNVKHAISANCDGSVDKAAKITFGYNSTEANVDGCYQDSSYAKLGWGGASYPGTEFDVQRVTINDTVTSCNYTSWGSKADAVAVNLGNYQHRVYVVPSDTNCSWAGVAYVNSCPGSYCQAWVKAYSYQECGYIDGLAHEVGHNLGLMHASTDTNNDGTIDCEYCDDSDFMGYAEGVLRPSNGPHRVQMGWVSGGGIIDATAGGQFTLAPLSQYAAPLPQVAKITAANGYPYYLSYRIASGYDSFVANSAYSAGVLDKVNIHRWPGGVNNTLFIAAVGDGQSFTDATNRITITQTSHSATSATFTVSTGVGAPTNLKATAGDSLVALTWTASTGASSYNVKRASVSGGPFGTIASSITATTYNDTNVVNGQTYYYAISSVSSNGESANSTQVSATPNGIDLMTTAISNPPASAAPGATFSVTDTVKNNGAATAPATTTRYYLSADSLAKDASDVMLGGVRSVPSLAAGQSSSGTVTVSIPGSLPAGTYYLLSCADDLLAAGETAEGNNCRASSTTLQISLPDLIVTAVTIPAGPVAPGATIRVSDTVKNQGTVAAGAFTKRYYLSTDGIKDATDPQLTGSDSETSLAAGASSSANVNVTLPTTAAVGTYYVLSCADDSNSVPETNETNNCKPSGTTIQVTLPDLVASAITIGATSVTLGSSFKVTSTIRNQGSVQSAASTTRFYLSTDNVAGTSGILLAGTRSVSTINAGNTSSGNTNVTAPAGTAAGTYFVIACADDTKVVPELSETNNCVASATTVVLK